MMTRTVSLVVVVFLAVAAPSPAAHPMCQPGPETEAVLEAVGSAQELLELSPGAWRERLALVEAALEERPDDLFLHRQHQDLYRWGPKDVREEGMTGLVEEYAALREDHPEDPRFLYLLGRITDDEEVEAEAFAAVVEADPDFPWGHLGRAAVAVEDRDAEAEERTERVRPHVARFLELCPDRIYEALVYHRSIDDPAFWKERLPGLRERIRTAPDEHFQAMPFLWSLEFRLAEPAEHASVRERIATDVEALESLAAEEVPVLEVLKEGYELAGDVEKATEVEARLRAADPCSMDSVLATINDWAEDHAPQRPGLSPEERREATEGAVEETGRWVERCPDAYLYWQSRLRALDGIEAAEPTEIVAAAERVAELYARWRGHSFPSAYEQVAEVLIDRRLELDRALELLERTEAEAVKRRAGQDLSSYPEDERRTVERNQAYADWRRQLLVARARIARGGLESSGGLLGDLSARLEELDPGQEAASREELSHAGYESALWEARAELAEAEGRAADAVAFLLRAAAVKPEDVPYWVQGPERSEARERAAELWSELGGSPEGLAALERTAGGGPEEAATLADYSPWVESSEPLPAFELADLSGKVWKLAELEGKTVFANAWATWCGPCRWELPVVQTLHERLADRDDVVVLTLNMDSNPGAVAPYLTKEGFTFPVLLAFDYLQKDAEVFAIPQSWILDGTGTVRFEQRGFDESVAEEDWLSEVEEKVEAAGTPE